MKATFDAVIIGGGIQGLSLAYHLTRLVQAPNRLDFAFHVFMCYTCLRGGRDGNKEYHLGDSQRGLAQG